jgi:hypothetical protein
MVEIIIDVMKGFLINYLFIEPLIGNDYEKEENIWERWS